MSESENEFETLSEGNIIEENEFEKMYRNLGKKMREENESNIKLEDLNKKVNLLKDLYINNKEKKILFIGGVNVLLPIFEILYKLKKKIGRKKNLN